MSTGSIFLLPNGTWFVELAVVVIILWVVTKYALPMLGLPDDAPMVTRDMVRHAKPDPDLFLAAAAVLGVEPQYVGCTEGDDRQLRRRAQDNWHRVRTCRLCLESSPIL